MISSTKPPEGAAAIWNDIAGQTWVELQDLLDAMFAPVEMLLADEVTALGARAVLDVGCGTGATTLAAARRLAGEGSCFGVDISEAMIASARERAAREHLAATFASGDAQRYAFAPAIFDLLISRFGVMFFDDFVAAFANLRGAARDGASLRFVTWRSAQENPFMTTAERVAAPLLPDLPLRDPVAPGQFGLADRERATRLLEAGGWAEIDHQPIDFSCAFPVTALELYFTRLGPVGSMLQKAEVDTRTRAIEVLRPAFEPYVVGDQVRFDAACWLVSAKAV